MRAFIRQNARGEYASPNFAVAADGFHQMLWDVVGFEEIGTIARDLIHDDVVVDFIDESRSALRTLGAELPAVQTYPECLAHLLGRRIWRSTINKVASDPDTWPVFVKPRDDSKKFTGVLVRGTRDLIGCGDPEIDTPVWCSEPVKFLREWRCFLREGRIVDVRPYRGDWRAHFDPAIIEEAVQTWTGAPRGCALDFGVDARGRTLLVEANDGFALGAYGLHPLDYARLLAGRWWELTGSRMS